MRVRRSAGLTDPGRKRRRNEDAFVCESPLFAVADGMGGAQAGEIASRLAAAALREGTVDGGGGQERVASLIQEANRRVFERSSADASVSGMGTTMTVVLVGEDVVTIGHVGDSRAYLVRDGRLEQVTEDHSLVAELVRSGKLSPEEAERHPQRSVITRVLGVDAEVDIDTFTVEAREGDLFMICSDGLTSMIGDDTILAAVEQHRSDLRRAAKALIEAANREGGEDNITVVLVELAGGGLEDTQTMPAIETADVDGDAAADDEDTLSGLEAPPAAAGVTAEQLDEWLELDAGPPPAAHRSPWPRRHPIVLVLAALVGVGAVFALALWGLSSAHFVGVRADGHVAVYQGLPFDITKSVRLYREVYVSPLYAAQLSPSVRRRLFAHDLRGYDAAVNELRPYEHSASP